MASDTDLDVFHTDSQPEPQPPRRRLGRIVFLAALGLFTLLLGFSAIISVRTYRTEREIFFPPKTVAAVSREATGIVGLAPAHFRAEFNTLRGWYAPSHNGAAILLIHGAGGNRSALLTEARALASAGFGVLLFDLPGHGASDGEIRWAQPERAAIRAAVTFLASQPGVRADRIGAFGFSMGGYSLLQFAARDTQLRAVAIAAAPPDPVEQSAWQFGRLGPFTRLPAKFALRSRIPDADPTAREVIRKLSPRPLLMLGGSRDGTVPEFMVRDLFANARAPKELFIIPGAEHSNLAQVGGSAYTRKITDFFSANLLDSRTTD